jgi:hypothetical protein
LQSIGRHSLAILLASTALGVVAAHAVDATSVGGNGGDPNEWVEPNNWTPATVPDGVATFLQYRGHDGRQRQRHRRDRRSVFHRHAQAYTINIDNPFIVNAAGIVNNSTNTQTFNVTSGNSLVFQNDSSASAGMGTVRINNQNGGFIVFQNSSTAGEATITNTGVLTFDNTATAATSTIDNNGEAS